MSEQLKEALSAALDNEADEFELRRVLDETGRNDGLRETFERYQLIQSTLRGDANARTLAGRHLLQRRVRIAMDVDVVHPAEEKVDEIGPADVIADRPVWWPRAAAFLIAMGAAVTVYLGADLVLPGSHSGSPANDVARTSVQPLTTPVTSSAGVDEVLASEALPEIADLTPEVRKRHEQWLSRHRAGGVSRPEPNFDETAPLRRPGLQPAWVPTGFAPVPLPAAFPGNLRDTTWRYSDGHTAFTLVIEAAALTLPTPFESRSGDSWIVERVVHSGEGDTTTVHLAAVAGELSPPAARRVLGSLSRTK